jgi:hypothetical protein
MYQRAIGSLFGRLLGKSIYDILRTTMDDTDEPAEWDFSDPGALVLIGSGLPLSLQEHPGCLLPQLR